MTEKEEKINGPGEELIDSRKIKNLIIFGHLAAVLANVHDADGLTMDFVDHSHSGICLLGICSLAPLDA